jgi:hypothetical protein
MFINAALSLVLIVQLLKKVLLKFDGLNYRQEYLCLGLESFSNPLHVYLLHNGKPVKDITNLHCFVGYSPLVFAIDHQELKFPADNIEMVFSQQSLSIDQTLPRSAALAFLKLDKVMRYSSIVFFEGKTAWHHFTNRFHQKIGNVINHYFNRKPGNVFLDNNLYKQVQVAYSIPRKISLITVGKEEFYNLFPTDLHGQPTIDRYIISLRHEGYACRQVMQSGTIVLSEMPAKAYKTVYSLGKNHMQPLKQAGAFPFSPDVSANFQLPLPEGVLAYKELELEHGFNHGIHRIMIFRILHQTSVHSQGTDQDTQSEKGETDSLVHIHNVYATWREKNGFQSNFLLR